jgi:hypothetical protein
LGSGCNKTYYSIIGSSSVCPSLDSDYIECESPCSDNVTCSEDSVCNKSVCFFSKDNAGNLEGKKKSNPFLIDKTKPFLEILSPEQGSLQRINFPLKYNITDSGSGLDPNECKLYTNSNGSEWVNRGLIPCGENETTITVGEDSQYYCHDIGKEICKIMLSAKDNAGNQNNITTNFSIDWTPVELARFVTRNLTMILGRGEMVEVEIINPCTSKSDNVSLLLDGYEYARFVENGEEKIKIGVDPGGVSYTWVKLYSSIPGSYTLKLIATSSFDPFCEPCFGGDTCLESWDQLGITVIPPIGFSGLSEWAIILLIISACIIWIWVNKR